MSSETSTLRIQTRTTVTITHAAVLRNATVVPGTRKIVYPKRRSDDKEASQHVGIEHTLLVILPATHN